MGRQPRGHRLGGGTGTTRCRWSLAGRTVHFDRADDQGPAFYYYATTATVDRDGRLTEDTGQGLNGVALYPRIYRR